MAKKPVWQDTTYQKQISYYKKLLGDFLAQETRKKADVGTYYGTSGTADKKTTKTIKAPTMLPVKKGNKIVGWKRGYKNVKVTSTTKGKDPTDGLYQSELREQRTKDTGDIQSDYASRGLIHSGLYAQKRGDYETEFGKQMSEISRQRSKQYGDISSEHNAFLREQELQKENARLEAIRRRAAKTGDLLI